MNRSILAAIRAYINGEQDNWDDNLQLIASAIRSSVNRHSGESPNLMMLGREINTPLEFVFPGIGVEVCSHDYVIRLQEKMRFAHKKVREHLEGELKTTKNFYDRSMREVEFKIGDPVYYLNKSVKKGKNRKLQQVFQGPGVILEKISTCNYVVKIENIKNISKFESVS